LQVTGTNATANASDVTDLNNLAASDIQTELVTYDAIKGTEGAWTSDVLAASDIQAELVTFDGAKSSDVAAELVTYDAATGTEIAAIPTTNLDTSDIPTVGAVADAVWDEVTTDHVAAGTFGLWLDTQISTISLGVAGTDIADIADAVWDEVTTDHVGVGTFGENLDAQISGITASVAATDIADVAAGVWDVATTDHVSAGTFGLWLDTQISTLSLAFASTDIDDIADAVWDEVTTDHVAAGTFGLWLDTQVSTLENLAASDIQAELVTYDAATGTEIGNVPTTNLDSSDIAAELVTYDAATGTEFATLNNLADTDILGYTLETGYTVAQSLKLIGSALAGKVSGGGTTTIVFRDLADGSDRITATVDSDGNRSAMTLNP
jgi:hypothetical protein